MIFKSGAVLAYPGLFAGSLLALLLCENGRSLAANGIGIGRDSLVQRSGSDNNVSAPSFIDWFTSTFGDPAYAGPLAAFIDAQLAFLIPTYASLPNPPQCCILQDTPLSEGGRCLLHALWCAILQDQGLLRNNRFVTRSAASEPLDYVQKHQRHACRKLPDYQWRALF